eukprot:8574648-Pyramimonas_sp.AAC.1
MGTSEDDEVQGRIGWARRRTDMHEDEEVGYGERDGGRPSGVTRGIKRTTWRMTCKCDTMADVERCCSKPPLPRPPSPMGSPRQVSACGR